MSSTTPEATRRQVLRRDRGRCSVPGCRASMHLQVHHVVARAEGGTHDPRGLMALCTAHHRHLHQGKLEVTGRFPDFVIRRVVGEPARRSSGPEASAPPAAIESRAEADAILALRGLGFSRGEAVGAVTKALAHVSHELGDAIDLKALIIAALRLLRPAS